jgi:hypothetical protein
LRGLDSEAGRAVSAYLELTGYRLLDGFDISGRYALEMPDALLRAIRAQVEGTGETATPAEVEAKIAEIGEKVPPEHREEFDNLVEEARLMYRIRDERGVYSDIGRRDHAPSCSRGGAPARSKGPDPRSRALRGRIG